MFGNLIFGINNSGEAKGKTVSLNGHLFKDFFPGGQAFKTFVHTG